MKAFDILQTLSTKDKRFKKKVQILAQLIEDKDGGYILDDSLVMWAKHVGIKVHLHCEDRCSWWTCRI